MAPRTVPLTLGTGSNPGRYGYDGAARLINCYVEQRGPEGRAPFPIYAIDGLGEWSSVAASGGVRAMLAMDNTLYVVVGRIVYAIDASGAETELGGLPSDGPVYMARNRRSPNPQIAVVCDGIYKMISGSVLTDVNDADLPPPSSVTHLDGYFVFGVSNGRMYASAIDDGNDIAALDFAAAEGNPDDIVMVTTRGRELLAVGSKSTEFWSNTAQDNFAFSRANSIEIGCLSGKSVASISQTIAFVAHDGTIRILDGYTPQRISNHAVERFIADTTDKSTLVATSWSDRGHSFYCLSSPIGTWTYDMTTQLWHERKSYGLDRWRVSCVERFGDQLIAGHYDEGTLYTMSPGVYAEGGDPILMEVRPSAIHAHPNKMVLHRLDVDVVPGVGLNTTATQNADPQLMIDTSEDGGDTFGGERSVALGTINQKLTTVSANRFGMIRATGKGLRLRCSADVVRGFLSGSVTMERMR